MSLINQVLKDLEKRHATRADVRGLPPSVRPLPDLGGRRTWWVWASGVTLLVVMAGVAVWWIGLRTVPEPRMAPTPPPVSQTPAGATVAAVPASPQQTPAAEPPASRSPVAAATAPSSSAGRDSQPTLQASQASAESTAVASLAAKESPGPPVGATAPSAPVTSAEQPPAAQPASSPRPADEVARPSSEAAEPAGSIDKPAKPLSAQARAEAGFRRGMDLVQQGRPAEAEDALHLALVEQPGYEQARQALVGLLLESGRRSEAEALLQEGLRAEPRQINLAMLLARLRVERGALQEALDTLQTYLPNAQWSADYLAMTAAVMARASRNREAAQFYEGALRIGPNNAVWTMGLGLALRADGRPREALAAFQRARDLGTLAPELQTYVERQIRDLQ